MDNAKPISAADMVSPLLEMPIPTVPAEKPAGPAPAATAEPVKDSLGRSFDAGKFAVDSSGKPRFDTSGRFINANAGRKSGGSGVNKATQKSASVIPPDAPADTGATEIPTAGKVDKYDLAADMYCRAGYGLAASAFSDEWMPDDDGEHEALRASVAAYLRAKGEIDLSPGAALALAVLGFAGKRIPRPKTQARLSIIFQRVRDWISGWKGIKRAKEIAAYSSPGAGAT